MVPERLGDGPLGDEQIHVLAVDDSVVDRKVIERLLKTLSFKVTTVGSGAKALEMLGAGDNCDAPNAFQVNLIITDYCMPEMTGYDLLKKLKEETSVLREIPVVIMSSENVPSRKRRCLAEGAEEFILKPVRLDDVKRLKGHVRFPSHLAVSDPCRGESTCSERNDI